MKTSFKNKCEIAANIAGVDVSFYPESDNQMPFSDDGSLHVTCDGVRAVFEIGQDVTDSSFNYDAKRILAALGYRFTSRTAA